MIDPFAKQFALAGQEVQVWLILWVSVSRVLGFLLSLLLPSLSICFYPILLRVLLSSLAHFDCSSSAFQFAANLKATVLTVSPESAIGQQVRICTLAALSLSHEPMVLAWALFQNN